MKDDFKTTILTHGERSFTAYEKGEGPIVLLLHGFPDHPLSYREQINALADKGYRAIAVTMRGYEPSSQLVPHRTNDYAIIRLAEDVIAWIDQLGGKVHLVGHDWGAVVSYVVAGKSPEKLISMCTMAVPDLASFSRDGFKKYPKQLGYSWYMFFFQLRGISDFVVGRNDYQFIKWIWHSWCPEWDIPNDLLDEVAEIFQRPGVKTASLAYYRAMFKLLSQHNREGMKYAMRKKEVPCLAIGGDRDGCIYPDVFANTMDKKDYPQGLRVEQVKNAGHFLQIEQPQAVNQLLIDWLSENAS